MTAMNSDGERDLLESWGWVYDHVARRWIAPDGYELEIEALVVAANLMTRREMESQLRDLAAAHGRARR